ncbi:hypothetical protein U8016_004241 [Vibrio parahaemolyticus]|jgi:hypothetical protein|nr:hypothetical protein [Vibrio parahaemolyticus]
MERQKTDTNLSQMVISHVDNYLSETNTKREAFVKERLLPRLVHLGLVEEPSDADSQLRWINTTSRRLARYLSGENEIKADWVLPILSSLPQAYLTHSMNDICGAFGSYYTPITLLDTTISNRAIKSQLSNISHEFGNVLQTSQPVMDGIIDDNDTDEDLQLYVDKLFSLIAAGMAELGHVAKARGIVPAAHRAMASSPLFKANSK